MGNPFARFGMSDDEFRDAVKGSAEADDAINEFMESEVVPYWRSVSPVGEGAYAASVKVVRKARRGKGVVSATDYKAHWIEFGTGEPGPTKAFAPAEKTATHFGGTFGSGIGGK